ncbi:MAG TPA: ferritin-like domain-containing protein [Gemmatimonadaceae bacterium]|nr:ferritin-like domain-containing protein [Gemmatimonadaceae bacterium]
MEMESLRELYVDELKDLWSAETQITKALPKMMKAASNPKLKRAFNTHLKQTERHVKRLERIFKELDESPRGKKCVGMEGLIKEGQELIKEKPEADVLDAGLIAAAQHVEHYEIAGYGCVRTWARQMGEDRQAELLQETLDEEEQTDRLLTELAESEINVEAEEEDEEERPVTRSRSKQASKRGASRNGGSSDEDEDMEADEDETDEETVGASSGRSGMM